MGLGLPELLIMLPMMFLFWVAPVAAGIWALVTLARIRRTLEQMDGRLARIERQGAAGA